jgi:hypothetical protein
MEAMTNWLKPFSSPPVVKAKTPAARQEFEQKLAAFKKAHGFKERYSMLCVCTRFGRPFEVVFERDSAAERFTVGTITKLADQAGGGAAAAPQETRFDIKEFDTTGWRCPWCSSESWIHCPCGTNTCDHQYRLGGSDLHKCEPGCGAVSRVMPLKEFAASAASNAPQLPRHAKPALPGANRPSLPGPSLPRLPSVPK